MNVGLCWNITKSRMKQFFLPTSLMELSTSGRVFLIMFHASSGKRPSHWSSHFAAMLPGLARRTFPFPSPSPNPPE